MVAIRHSAAGFPMAPSEAEWATLTQEERAAVVAALPGEVTEAEMSPPEGDRHFKAKIGPLGALRGFFARQGRRIYLAAELPMYYPAEPRFAPDLLAVLEVADHDRDKWVVGAEGKGLDWVLEVHVGGDRKKDAELNVTRYARLGIPEYFLYDRARGHLHGYRLASRRLERRRAALFRGHRGVGLVAVDVDALECRPLIAIDECIELGGAELESRAVDLELAQLGHRAARDDVDVSRCSTVRRYVWSVSNQGAFTSAWTAVGESGS